MHSQTLDAPPRTERKFQGASEVRVSLADGGDAQMAVAPMRVGYLNLKFCLEYVGAILLLFVLSPFIFAAALVTKLSSRGPVFYEQTRVGLRGREFKILKIRTMVHDAESTSGAVWSQTGDPRITRFGWFLRATHIDEFPQLLNVLAGDMALIGPRPERPEFVCQLERKLPAYRERLNVRPGITGLSQLLLPPDSGLESVRKKLTHDLYYVQNVSLLLDAKIAFHTVCLLGHTLLWFLTKPIRLPHGPTVIEGLPENVAQALTEESVSSGQHQHRAAESRSS